MAPSNYLPKLRIALLFGAALMPALSLAQSVQAPPLPKAPPEIMSKETRDPKACAQGLTVGLARSWRGGAGTIEADSLRLVGTARGCPVRPQNFAM